MLGKEGLGISPRPARVSPMLWAGICGRAARGFPLGPGWASKPLTPLDRGWTRGSPETKRGPRFIPCSPGVMGERAKEREVPTQARVSTEDFGWSTGRPSIGKSEMAY